MDAKQLIQEYENLFDWEKKDMRTIKFRGKRIDTGAFVYGDLIHRNDGDVSIYTNLNTWAENQDDVDAYGDSFRVDNSTIGQFTELHDKNGNEIYEGDIIEIDEEMYAKVVWDKERARFEYQLFRPIHIVNTFHEFNMPYLLVVGNIHDNPELLKK